MPSNRASTAPPEPVEPVAESTPHPLTDGKYVHRPVDTVWTWPEGEESPSGPFKLQPNGDAVLVIEGTDEPDRDIAGSAGIVRPGGTLVFTSDGYFRTLNADESEGYAESHVKED
jgi:hypothetical protein